MHFIERLLARSGNAAEQDQPCFDARIGATVFGGVAANLLHVGPELGRSLKRGEVAVGQTSGAPQNRIGAPAHPDVHRGAIVVVTCNRTRLDTDVVEVEETPVKARLGLGPHLAQDFDSFVESPSPRFGWNPTRRVVCEICAGAHRHYHPAAGQIVERGEGLGDQQRMPEVQQQYARSELHPGGARCQQREGCDHVEFGRRCKQVIGEPERIEPPVLGALGDARDRFRRWHPEPPQAKPGSDFDLLHDGTIANCADLAMILA